MAVTDHDEAVSARDFPILPLSPAIGIEVLDIDLTQPLNVEAFPPSAGAGRRTAFPCFADNLSTRRHR